MSGEEMNEQTIDELAREMEERALDMRVISALERIPDGVDSIPEEFAARVAAKVPARRTVEVKTTHFGRAAMWGCFAILLIVLVVAAAAQGAGGRSAVETAVGWTLFVQFLGLAVWLGVRQWRTN